MISNSLLLTALVLGIILLIPILCRKIHVPAIVGFILAGMVVGPSVLNWVDDNATIRVLGSIGMLYIMFQSGSEIDMNDFSQHRYRAILFGLLTFLFPLGLGLLTCRYILGFDSTTALLLGAMFGSHTLMTYPIVSRYGIQKNRAVNITVGATMWAITFSLLVLAVVESMQGEAHSAGDILRTIALIILFLGVVLWAFPKMAQWFFKRYQDPVVGFMLVMLMLVLAALVLADTKITAEIRSVVLKAVVLAARKADLIFLLFLVMIFFLNT